MLIETFQRSPAYQTWTHVFEKYEWLLMPLMLLFGVSTDFIGFLTLDIVYIFYWLGFHVLLAGFWIVMLNLPESTGVIRRYTKLFAPVLLQLSFGALLNASLVFYWYSGSLSVSWPFFAIILLLMVSNDVFRKYFMRPIVQLSVYFFATFSVFALIVPYLLNSIDPSTFIIAGLASLLFSFLFLQFIGRSLSNVRPHRFTLFAILLGIYLFMNGLYFLNLIPPIPLSLRDAHVYHFVSRSGSDYHVLDEQESWLDQLLPGETIHVGPDESVYVFTSIFAPANLQTQIFHQWQFFDPAQKKWVNESHLPFPIIGGRSGGYRGYSFRSNVQSGKWRVSVETSRGQVLGRVGFTVVLVDKMPVLIDVKK